MGRSAAIRIRQLPRGSIQLETVHAQKYQGSIEKEPTTITTVKSPVKTKDVCPGIIMYDVDGVKQTIPYSAKSIQGHLPKYGDKVRKNKKIYMHYLLNYRK